MYSTFDGGGSCPFQVSNVLVMNLYEADDDCAVIASVPLLVTYAAGQGVTDIVLPRLFGLRSLLGVEGTNGVVHLGG